MNTDTTTTKHLSFKEGSSDKVYQVSIESDGKSLHSVTFAYGRRGTTLTYGCKTTQPVTLPEATKIRDSLVKSKLSKGYQIDGESQQPESQTPDPYVRAAAGNPISDDSGIRCQLLNPIEESEVQRLLADSHYCLQEKHDGRRLMILKRGDQITAINRRGLIIECNPDIRTAACKIPHDVLLDGEVIGDTYRVFDLLETAGRDLRSSPYSARYAALRQALSAAPPTIALVAIALGTASKTAAYNLHRRDNREGVVFKDIRSPFTPGRPNSAGSQLKFKFVETASFIVLDRHTSKRSVSIGLIDSNPAFVGNVTIPPNHQVPPLGSIIEVRYLYAYRGGSIYQPVYIAQRDDIPATDCTASQLKYKPE